MYVFVMYIMCLIIYDEKAEVQDQYPLSLNPVQKADDPIQDRNSWAIECMQNIFEVIILGKFRTKISL